MFLTAAHSDQDVSRVAVTTPYSTGMAAATSCCHPRLLFRAIRPQVKAPTKDGDMTKTQAERRRGDRSGLRRYVIYAGPE